MALIPTTNDPGHHMDSAPKDGTYVLIYGRNMNFTEPQFVVARNMSGMGMGLPDHWNIDEYIWEPWRWWPLPDAPPEPN